MKGWLAGGILMTLLGLIMIVNGLNQRLSSKKSPAILHISSLFNRPNAHPESYADSVLNSTSHSDTLTTAQAQAVNSEHHKPLEPQDSDSALSSGDDNLTSQIDEQLLKNLLVKKISAAWPTESVNQLKQDLADPRASFRLPVLERMTSHVETVVQYSHQNNNASLEMCREFWRRDGSKALRGRGDSAVPVEVILAVLKVESNFGKWPPPESVFNVFWTLSLGDDPQALRELGSVLNFSDPEVRKKLLKLAPWARKELKDLISLRAAGTCPDPISLLGSWAGAFGLCQFVPSSYVAYARDGDGDGVIDLYNPADAASSIANYLEKNGWPADGDKTKMIKALKRYNHSEPYANAVLTLADNLRDIVRREQKFQ